MNKDTERFIRSRIEMPLKQIDSAPPIRKKANEKVEYLPFRRLAGDEIKPFMNCVPLFDLKIAASGFSPEQQVDDCDWVELPEAFRPNRDLFVSKVVGESMNRRIPNGAWCLFRVNPGGTRQGKVVLVQHREIQDVDTGGHYTVKVYQSEKTAVALGGWRHKKIVLHPDSNDLSYEPIVLDADQAESLKVIAELIAVLS